ncbi:hypothetical protein DFJ73DRAFT_776269 [Zopfochytrium polystomum]|nr:hypothetical protein DFJ73DRAFT_776269 [Zopfochytrium polystomum]
MLKDLQSLCISSTSRIPIGAANRTSSIVPSSSSSSSIARSLIPAELPHGDICAFSSIRHASAGGGGGGGGGGSRGPSPAAFSSISSRGPSPAAFASTSSAAGSSARGLVPSPSTRGGVRVAGPGDVERGRSCTVAFPSLTCAIATMVATVILVAGAVAVVAIVVNGGRMGG